jgi:hypothetical protein
MQQEDGGDSRSDGPTLSDRLVLLSLVLDVPTGSTPATTLMQDTTWNLCPTPGNSFFDIATSQADENMDFDKTYIVGCYYAPDEEQTFDQLSGKSI